MKLACAVLLVTAVPAAAAPDPVHLLDLERVEEPPLDPRTAETCDGPANLATARRVMGTSVVLVLHDCGTDAMSRLALHTPGGWFLSQGATISYQGANMTDTPLHITLTDERLSGGVLADGTPAVVHSVVTLHQDITTCYKQPCTPEIVDSHHELTVEVCTTGAGPACSFTSAACPAKGCAAAKLSRGVLIIGDDRMRIYR